MPFDDHSKYFSNYSIDGAPNFGIILKMTDVYDKEISIKKEDQYDITNLLNIYLSVYFDNISKRVYIFYPVSKIGNKNFYINLVLENLLCEKYGFRVADKSCFHVKTKT